MTISEFKEVIIPLFQGLSFVIGFGVGIYYWNKILVV